MLSVHSRSLGCQFYRLSTPRRPCVREPQASKFDAAQVGQQQRLLEESDFTRKQSQALVSLVSFAVEPLATSEAVKDVEAKVDSVDKKVDSTGSSVKWTLGLSAVALAVQLMSIFAPPQALAAPLFNFIRSLLPK